MEGARLGEEDGYNEDGLGSLGAFSWPPRSYFCNFCGREFGSAQALGGHMNVHRRDRARLKQSPGLENGHLHHHHNHYQHQSPRKIVRSKHPYTLLLNPDSTSATATRVFLSAVSGSGISTPDHLTEENCQKLPPVVSCDDNENNVKGKRSFPFLPISKSNSRKNDHPQDEVKKLCVGKTQDLDLELRLGFSLF